MIVRLMLMVCALCGVVGSGTLDAVAGVLIAGVGECPSMAGAIVAGAGEYPAVAWALMAWSGASPGAPARARSAGEAPGAAELLLDPRPGTGAVCAVVAVPVGSAFETSATRGISHLIEHMVFDGSERYSRLDMSGWVDDVGGFLNAFTRTETTVYFLLVPSDRAEKGIEILSQMLLHSIFPPEELDKERKVIAEEIRREVDDPQSARERIVDRSLYRGSPLSDAIIGTPSTVETVSREEILDFYGRHYDPSRMGIVLMGDFNVDEAKGWVKDYFTTPPHRAGTALPQAGRYSEPASEPRWSNEIEAIADSRLAPGFDMVIPLPSVDEKDFPAALLVSAMLGGTRSPLPAAFKLRGLPEPEVSLEVHRGFSALRVHVDAVESAKAPYDSIPAIIASLARWRPTEEIVIQSRVSFTSSEMFDREMYHLYIMSRGEGIGLFGEPYIAARTSGVSRVKAGDCARVLGRVFTQMRFNACLLTSRAAGDVTPTDETPGVEVFPNGLTAASLARPASPVAALHLLIKGRNCAEGGEPRGLAEVLHTLLESSRAGVELARELEGIGARVQFGDNPYVPQDDYLLNPAFSFIRLESPVESSDRAIGLLVKSLLACDFTGEELEAAKKALAREFAVRSGSPAYALRSAVFHELFGAHPFGASLFPSPPALGSVTLEEVKAFAKKYLTGGNVIASFVSPEEPDRALGRLRELLSAFPPGSIEQCPPFPGSAKTGSLEMPTKKEGAYLAVSWLVPANDCAESASILVAAEVLSRRIQLEIREKLGLAYSTDCAVSLLPGGAVVYASLGTGAARLAEAERALEEETKGLVGRPPDEAEVAIARSRLIGKRTRSELSSINRAYVLGLDLFLCGPASGRRSMSSLIASVPPEAVARVVSSSLPLERALRVKLIPGQGQGAVPGGKPGQMPGQPQGDGKASTTMPSEQRGADTTPPPVPEKPPDDMPVKMPPRRR